MKNYEIKKPIGSIIEVSVLLFFFLFILSMFFTTFENEMLVKEVIARYRPTVDAASAVKRTKCKEVPVELGSRVSHDLAKCEEFINSNGLNRLIDNVVLEAQLEYMNILDDRGFLYLINEGLTSGANKEPPRLDSIEKELKSSYKN